VSAVRALVPVVAMVVLHGLLWGLIWLGWLAFEDSDMVAEYILPDGYQDEEDVEEVVGLLAATLNKLFFVSFLCSLAWLVYSEVLMHPFGPGQARKGRGIWWLFFMMGTATAVLVALGSLGLEQTDLIRPDISGILVVIYVLVFMALYFLAGTLLTTPPHMRVAVPLASLFLRHWKGIPWRTVFS
jgi:hypothetical protein